MTLVILAALTFIGLGLSTFGALAAPPPGVSGTGPVAEWVKRWHDTTGFPCCGIESDCRPTIIRPNDAAPSGYEAWIGKEQFGTGAPDDWRPIPVTAFSPTSEQNPTGASWVCWYGNRVLCASRSGGF